ANLVRRERAGLTPVALDMRPIEVERDRARRAELRAEREASRLLGVLRVVAKAVIANEAPRRADAEPADARAAERAEIREAEAAEAQRDVGGRLAGRAAALQVDDSREAPASQRGARAGLHLDALEILEAHELPRHHVRVRLVDAQAVERDGRRAGGAREAAQLQRQLPAIARLVGDV